MTEDGSVVVVGGTSGLGREIAAHYASQRRVVVTGRDAARAQAVADEIGAKSVAAFDLADPSTIAPAVADLGPVAHLVVAAIDRDENTIREYDMGRAQRLATMKLVGYSETIHALLPQMSDDTSIVVFGGLAKDRPYPGSTTVTTVNGAVTSMVRTLAVELAPIRVNALHPAIVGDSPYWRDKPPAVLENLVQRTPLGRLVTMADIVHATVFLLENRSVTGINLHVDGGWLLT